MTSDIDNALTPSLLDAFRSIINLDGSAVGTLKIAAGATKGDIVIVRGVVVRAWINTSGQCGMSALKTLLAFNDCAFRFTEGEVTGERIDVYIPVDELIRNKLNVEACISSSPEVDDLNELLRQVRFEKSQAALQEGESLETTEIPDSVYEEFIEFMREPSFKSAAATLPAEPVVAESDSPSAVTESAVAEAVSELPLVEQEEPAAAEALCESPVEPPLVQEPSGAATVRDETSVEPPSAKGSGVLSGPMTAGTASGAHPAIRIAKAGDAPVEDHSQRKGLPKITGSVVVRPTGEHPVVPKVRPTGEHPVVPRAASSDHEPPAEMPDLSSWVSQSMQALTLEEAIAINNASQAESLPVDSEVFDAAPPAEEPIYVNIADSQQLANLKDKRSGDASLPFGFDDEEEEFVPVEEPLVEPKISLSCLNAALAAKVPAPEVKVKVPDEAEISGIRTAELNAIPTPKVAATPVAEAEPPSPVSASSSSTRPVVDESLSTSSRQRRVQSMERTSTVSEIVTGALSDGALANNNFAKLGGMLALVVVFVLCGALIYLPVTMKSEADRADSVDLAQNQTDMVVDSNTVNAVPYIKQ